MWPSVQVNRNGFSQHRVLAVDIERGHLLNMDRKLQLKKALPLRHMVQIEKSVTDPLLLGIVFTSTGLGEMEVEAIETLETTYDVKFQSPTHRDEFIGHLMEGYASATGSGADFMLNPLTAPGACVCHDSDASLHLLLIAGSAAVLFAVQTQAYRLLPCHQRRPQGVQQLHHSRRHLPSLRHCKPQQWPLQRVRRNR